MYENDKNLPVSTKVERVVTIDPTVPINPYLYGTTVITDDCQHFGDNVISDKMLRAYALSHTIRWCAFIDFIMSLLYCFYGNYYFFIPIILSISGWYGAVRYNSYLTGVYLFYIFAYTFAKDYFFFYEFLNSEVKNRHLFLTPMILVCMNTLINIWIMKLIFSFNNIISKFDETIIYRLAENRIVGVKKVYVLW